jgi:hypothetical protein
MVTFECKDEKCKQKDVKIDFFGNPEYAECGGCGITLSSFDLRDDPEYPNPMIDNPEAS